LFELSHYTTRPGEATRLLPPPGISSKFIVKNIWTQPTLDGPIQIWRATSKYSLQDYSGTYTLELLACVAKNGAMYNPESEYQKCVVETVLRY